MQTATSQRFPFEFEGVVRLTRIGTTYILGTAVLAIAAVNTGNNALYIGVSFMLGCLLLSGMASKGGLKQLEVEITGIDEAWAGRVCEGRLRVRNHSRIWNVRDVVLTSPALAEPVYLPILRRRSDVWVTASLLFRRRGRVQIGAMDSYTRYPFGFVLKKRRIRLTSDVVVFPRLLDESTVRAVFQPHAGEPSPMGRAGQGTDLHSFRDYVAGDSLRFVHWKKSASLGRWIMKQTEADAGRALAVVIDPYRPPGATEESFEGMIEEAATLIDHALRRGFEVTLSIPRQSLRASGGRGAASLYRTLALLEPVHEPVWQHVERFAVHFSLAGVRHDAQSA